MLETVECSLILSADNGILKFSEILHNRNNLSHQFKKDKKDKSKNSSSVKMNVLDFV